MPRYEYKVIPAPTKGLKGKGVKGPEARFSHAIQELMNGLAGYGWEYQRAETLPSLERSGLASTTTEWRNVLVFRRLRENDVEAFAPELLPPPAAAPVTREEPTVETAADTTDESKVSEDETQTEVAEDAPDETSDPWDNGVEDTKDVKGVGATLEALAATRNESTTEG
jgi:hypothetical protein